MTCHKQPHANRPAAKAHLAHLLRTGQHILKAGPLHVYRCDECGAFHVGHRKPRRVVAR